MYTYYYEKTLENKILSNINIMLYGIPRYIKNRHISKVLKQYNNTVGIILCTTLYNINIYLIKLYHFPRLDKLIDFLN